MEYFNSTNDMFGHIIYQLPGRDLAMKVPRSNTRHVLDNMEAARVA